MKKVNFKYLIPVLILFILGSCTKDFEETNTNPNLPGIEQAPTDMLLTNAIESMTDRVHEIFLGHEMGSCWAQHMAKVQYTDEDRYIPRISVINNSWNSLYAASGYDIYAILKIAEAQNLPNYKGVGLVLQAYITSLLTDLFGNVPFTEAWKGAAEDGGIMRPVYDSQESIYRTLIANLDEANTLLTGASPVNGDILYEGDVNAWRKFANSLRIKLIMRMSNRDESFAATELTNMIETNPDDYPIFESNDDNTALQYLGSAPNNNPINENRKTRDDHRVSKTLVDYLYTTNSFVDWRISLYANLEANGDYVGLPNGLTSAKASGYNENGMANTSKLGSYFTEASAPGLLLTYAQVQLFLAEAAKRGLIGGGDAVAEEYYYEGIYASYTQHSEGLATALEEHGWLNTLGGQGYDSTTTLVDFVYLHYLDNGAHQGPDGAIPVLYDADEAIHQIAYERWVANFGMGLEAWFEWRRMDYPILTPAEDGVNSGKIPVRVIYPSDEAARNLDNLNAAINAQGADNLNTPVWWDTPAN